MKMMMKITFILIVPDNVDEASGKANVAKASGNSRNPFGRVVGIIKRNWRRY